MALSGVHMQFVVDPLPAPRSGPRKPGLRAAAIAEPSGPGARAPEGPGRLGLRVPPADEIPYGPVIVVRGPYKGRVGIYDDEEDDERGRPRFLVYLYDGTPRVNAMAVVAEGEVVSLPPSYIRIPSESEAIAILGLMQNTYTVGQLFTVAANHRDGLRALGVDALMQRAQEALASREPDVTVTARPPGRRRRGRDDRVHEPTRRDGAIARPA